MALPVWPTDLSTDALEGSAIRALHPEPIATEMDDGPVRRRRRTTATWAEVTLRLALTHDQFATFQAFVRDDLDHGASRFTMPVWKPGATLPLPEKTVQLTEAPAIEITVATVFVNLPLRVLDY